MGNLRACFVVATLALAACGDDGGSAQQDAAVTVIDAAIDAKQFFDAPPATYDFACASNPAPTAATANVTLSGTVTRVFLNGIQPEFQTLDGADLEACAATAANCTGQDQYDTATSANGGMYSLGPIATGSTPLDAYIRMTEGTSRTTYTFPAAPFTADTPNIPVLTFDPGLIALLSNFGCTQNDASNGILGLAVTDCANDPITENVTLSIKQGGTEVSGTTVIDLGALSAMAAGTFLVCNVPANATTTVGATYDAGTPTVLRAHDVRVVAGTTTATIIRPGY